jgi:hypothetical protein
VDALWLSLRSAADAADRASGRAAATAMVYEAHGSLSCRHAESSEPGLSGNASQRQMGGQYHLNSHHRTLALSLCRTGLVFGPGGGLVSESASKPLTGDPSGVDGRVAAAR